MYLYFSLKADLHSLPNREGFMSGSEANRQRVLSLLNTEREQILEQYRYIDIKSTAVKRGKPPMSEIRQLSFYDRAISVWSGERGASGRVRSS
jgi:hypothetical protein